MTYRHSPSLIVVLYCLVGILPLLTLVLGHFAIEHWVMGLRGRCFVFALAGGVSLWATLAGLRWEKFIRVTVQITQAGLSVTTREGTQDYAWSSLGEIRNNKLLQLLRIYSADGKLILAVDHLLQNYTAFKAELDNYWPPGLQPKNPTASTP